MSLLLDALKRAEQEKLTRHSDRPGPAEPPQRPSPSAVAAPVLELQPVPSSPAAASSAKTDAQTAQTVFKAKAGADTKFDRRILWGAAAVIAIAIAAAGVYLWHSLSALSPRRIPMPAARPAPITPAPALVPTQAAPPNVAPASPASSVSPVQVPSASGASSRPADDARVEDKRGAAPVEELLKQAQREPAAAPPVQLERSDEPKPRVAPDVEAGYRGLLAGDLPGARRHYAAAAEADPTNVDAQLGLATVEARSGNVPGAAAAYRRALELDPRNATALAGLAALADNASPEALENALRADIAQHPESAALQLTLGNLYASQRRWAEAQAAYFEAQRLQPGSADVAYNLAVSLDHLGQRRAAADFYRRALQARTHEGAQFDAAAASRRLAELSR